MALGMMGKKLGMTQLFDENGNVVPVTIIEVPPNYISQIKTMGTDGYNALQLAYGDVKPPTEGHKRNRRINRPEIGHLAKANIAPKRFLKEFRVDDVSSYSLGDEVTCELFSEFGAVDVTGVTKGRGFQGNIKRHGHARGPMSHGSRAHRRVCSIGSSATPSRVRKGQKMPGQMGNVTQTIRNLKIVEVDAEKALLLVKGAIPGPNGAKVTIKPTKKRARGGKQI